MNLEPDAQPSNLETERCDKPAVRRFEGARPGLANAAGDLPRVPDSTGVTSRRGFRGQSQTARELRRS